MAMEPKKTPTAEEFSVYREAVAHYIESTKRSAGMAKDAEVKKVYEQKIKRLTPYLQALEQQ